MEVLRTLRDLPVAGKRVLVRVDFNVPLAAEGEITDDTRIRAALDTIQYLLAGDARVILCSHLGRPKGKSDPRYSLAPCAARLSQLLDRHVAMAADVAGPSAQALARDLPAGEVMLVENTRFEPGEEKNDAALSRALAGLADVFVNDAFGAAHRAHASTVGVADFLPAAAGLLMEREIQMLSRVLTDPERPLVAVIGGAKISDKIGVIENLLRQVDTLIIGGGMANTFLKAQGFETGRSLVQQDKLELAAQLIAAARQADVQLLLPVDVLVASEVTADAAAELVTADAIGGDHMALDIGPETVRRFQGAIASARTVVWNGPMGVFEIPAFARGTFAVAEAVAACPGLTIVGGGDSVAAVDQAGVAGRISHISTGGGASLEFLEGRTLPGVAVLQTG